VTLAQKPKPHYYRRLWGRGDGLPGREAAPRPRSR
jgi:hypothetical protein